MAAPQREGSYRGRVIAMGLSETQENKLAQVGIRFALTQWFDANAQQWFSVENEDAEIMCYVILEKRDGGVNDINVRSLKESFGWTGSFQPLIDDTYVNHECQVFVRYEDFKGSRQLKASWIKAFDADPNPGVKKVSEAEARTIANRLGSKIRAVIGGAAPAKPNGAPVRPAAQPVAIAAGASDGPPSVSEPVDELPY